MNDKQCPVPHWLLLLVGGAAGVLASGCLMLLGESYNKAQKSINELAAYQATEQIKHEQPTEQPAEQPVWEQSADYNRGFRDGVALAARSFVTTQSIDFDASNKRIWFESVVVVTTNPFPFRFTGTNAYIKIGTMSAFMDKDAAK